MLALPGILQGAQGTEQLSGAHIAWSGQGAPQGAALWGSDSYCGKAVTEKNVGYSRMQT